MSTKKKIQGSYFLENLINPGPPILKGQPPLPATLNPELYETIIKTSFLTIDGDLIVLGDTTVENIDEIAIEDPVVTLNSNIDDVGDETIDNIPILPEYGKPVAGIAINRGREYDPDTGLPYPDPIPPNVPFRAKTLLRYNDTDADGSGTVTDAGYWEFTNNGVDYFPILTSSNFKLEDDLDPHLGGDLVVNNFKITSDAGGDIVIESANDIVIDSVGQIKANTPIGLQVVTTDPPLEAGYNTIYGKAIGSGGTGLYVRNQERTEELVSRSKAIVFGLIF